MSKGIKILTPRIYEHSDFFHNAYDFARKKSLNTNELCLELSHYLVEHFDKVWKIERPRIYKQICNLQSQLQQANEIINNPDTLIFQQQQLIGSLQSQLAEKEKEIESYKHFKITIGTMENNQVDISSTTYTDQDKISFCIEQLEKVKELLNTDFESIISWIDPYEDGECLTSMTYNHNNTIKIIDNQIKKLRGRENE